ncbi:ABC transporter permease [Clostridium sp. MSJ-8]|uniref:PhnE/PtxC family ABC transporter permease n=1 Tax=Clostridium sp. MSJ-8 TaxID=2841510 RepID=UPI00209DFDD5|nr:ABC transporter permease subunit [Clostridium sp. MSJ-8]
MMEVSSAQEASAYLNLNRKLSFSGKIKIKSTDKASVYTKATIGILSLLTIIGFMSFDYKDLNFWDAVGKTLQNFKRMFLHAELIHFDFATALNQIGITIAIAFLTTVVGAFIALILAVFAAKNLTNAKVSNTIKMVVAFIRAVPTVLWVLIFAVTVGLGSAAAILGLSFHTVGYLTKVYSESFEEMDEGVIEALKACGATFWQIVTQAVIPTSIRYIFVWTFLRFEINFTNAVAIAAVAGAGGIGFELFMASSFYFTTTEVGFITIMIFICAMILEFCSTKVKAKFAVQR